MIKSEDISSLTKALAKAQSAIQGAHKDSTNPHFKSRYADLESVWDACREPLTKNGLSVVQLLGNGDNGQITCQTVLFHETGQYIGSILGMTPTQNTPQAHGSCATYLRRYMLMAIVGIAPTDDDGNEASKPTLITHQPRAFIPPSKEDKPPQTFDEKKEEHVKAAKQFLLNKKGDVRLLTPFTVSMHNKPLTLTKMADILSKIDPEAPDAEPEG